MKHSVQAIVVAGAVVGLVSDPRLARTFQSERHPPGATLVPVEVTLSERELAEAIETAQEAAGSTPAAEPLDPEYERIKGQVAQERRERELRAKAEAELDEAEEVDEKPAARRGRR